MNNKKVLLGLSGGVDSTAAALLLREQGYDVSGFFFNVHKDDVELEKAKAVARELNIPFYSEDVSELFNDIVIQNFIDSYSCGKTPNPCVVCNPNVKFKIMSRVADKLGIYHLATGHYARLHKDEKDKCTYILRGKNSSKDQSYMLYRLPQAILSRLIFPLGSIDDKQKTRDRVRSEGISNSDRSDSQELCFVPKDMDYKQYLAQRGIGEAEGDFVDIYGNVLGKHKGIHNFTIGQRKHLGIALGKPAFVIRIDSEKNQVVLGDNKDLMAEEVIVEDLFFSSTSSSKLPEELLQYNGELTCKIRYNTPPKACKIFTLNDNEGRIKVKLYEKVRGVTPGQSAVFYLGDKVIGGGFISA